MKALVFHGPRNVSVDTVDDPTLKDSRDAIIRVTSTAICGSDLHIYNGSLPTSLRSKASRFISCRVQAETLRPSHLGVDCSSG